MPGLGGRKEAEVWGRVCPALPALPQETEPTLGVLPQHLGSHIKEGYRERDPRLLRTNPWFVDGFIFESSPPFLERNKETTGCRGEREGSSKGQVKELRPQPPIRTQ